MKRLITICLLIVTTFMVNAQSHNMGGNYNCKLKKGNWFNEEKHACPACAAKDKKEKDAKLAEDNRRAQVIWDKAKADKIASENARLEKIRLAQEEAKRIKDKEASDEIARDAMMKKYKEIANKGQIKSNVKGVNISSNLNIENIKTFSDVNRRIYGFKIDDTEVLTFPFEGKLTYIERIKGTNYFQVTVNKPDGYANGVFSHCYLVNYLGEKMKVEGISTFDFPIDVWKNTLYLCKNLSSPELCDNSYCYEYQLGGSSGVVLFDSQESAAAELKTMIQKGGGLAMCGKYSYHHVEQYKADLNCKFLEKTEGYQLRMIGR